MKEIAEQNLERTQKGLIDSRMSAAWELVFMGCFSIFLYNIYKKIIKITYDKHPLEFFKRKEVSMLYINIAIYSVCRYIYTT